MSAAAAVARKRPMLNSPAFCLEAVAKAATVIDHEPQSRGAAQCDLMSRVADHLYLGSWRDSADIALLRREGITHVLDCAKENEVPPCRQLGGMSCESDDSALQLACAEAAAATFVTKKISMVDDHSEDIELHLETAYEFIEAARVASGKVLVHCRRGISRSPAVIVAYLMRKENTSYDDALQKVKSVRATVSLNLAFREFLQTYDPESCLRRERSNITVESVRSAPGHAAFAVPTPMESPGTE